MRAAGGQADEHSLIFGAMKTAPVRGETSGPRQQGWRMAVACTHRRHRRCTDAALNRRSQAQAWVRARDAF